jgi:hypothetical protein
MGRFLKRLAVLFLVPLLSLATVYCVTDPYKTLRPFSLTYFDSTNRDYLSSELFVLNSAERRYDSFIFGSSRGCGINTYHWLKYLPEGSKQFLFQAWSETITGIDQKISYIDEHHFDIKNAIILIDIPGSFSREQLPTKALSIKDPRFSHQPRWLYHAFQFFNFVQKPSQWMRAIRSWIHPRKPYIGFDVNTNDWKGSNRNLDVSMPPERDSLGNLSTTAKAAFLKDYVNNPDVSIPVSKSLIDDSILRVLNHIHEVFQRHGTDYRIIITPGYCYKFPPISSRDLGILQTVFGENSVFDYSGRMDVTSDYLSFSDPNHFGLRIGWLMVEEIYNPENPASSN